MTTVIMPPTIPKKAPPDRKSIEHIMKHILASRVDWMSSDERERATHRAFKSSPANGPSLIFGAFAAEDAGFFIWSQFNDLAGTAHVVKFPVYFLPTDAKDCMQQAFMNFNEMLGRDAFTDIAAVRPLVINRVTPGRLPGTGEDD